MSVTLFKALAACSGFRFAPNLDTDPGHIHAWWQDTAEQFLTNDEDEEARNVQVTYVEQYRDGDVWKFADQSIDIDEKGEAQIKTFPENPDEAQETCCIRFWMSRPMTEGDVKQKHLTDLINPPT